MIKTVTIRALLGSMVLLAACLIPGVASAGGTKTIRVVAYNIDSDQGQDGDQYALPQPGLIVPSSGCCVTNGGVLEGIGEENVAGDPAQPIDVLALEETTSNVITVQPIVDGLNAFYSSRGISAGYAMSPYQMTLVGTDNTGNGPNAMVYNTNTLQLIASVGVGSPGGTGNGEYRQVGRYEFAPAGALPTAFNEFYVYVSHYKASGGSGNAALRNGEAQIVRADSATLPSSARVLYVGDFNCTTSTEAMYKTLTAAGINQAYDPLNPSDSYSITWGSSVLTSLTESATSLSTRYDYQMMTSNVLFGVGGGLAHVPGSYHAFANNGSTRNVNSGSDTALNNDLTTNVTGIAATNLYKDLTTATDHLPIVADYTIQVPTVFLIVMGKENWASISGNAAAPYINNTLLPMAAHAEQYYNPPGNHPGLPNYLWLEAGTNFGILADGDPSVYHQSTTNHLVTLLNNASISWTSYQEDIDGSVCPLTATNQYIPEHNPMVYFDDVTNTNSTGSTYCIANVRPFTELAGDLQSNVVTRYNFITPNLCDDMTGGAGCPGGSLITQGDTWLSNNIPVIMNSKAYKNNGVIFITWDQGDGSDGPVGMIVLSKLAKAGGYSSTVHYTHSSTLLTIQELLNVSPLLGDAANATDLSDLFIYGAQLSISPASGFSSSGQSGGTFSPSNQVYTLSNAGGVAMVWSVTNTVNWLSLSATSGTLAVGGTTNINVSLNSNVEGLSPGSYSDTVVFATSNGSGIANEPVSLTVNVPAPQLAVIPSSAFVPAGLPGGPFYPASEAYTVTNTGAPGGAPLTWTANNSAVWLTLSATNGSLAAGTSTNVIANVNTNAISLAVGNYSDTIGFTNVSNGDGNTTRAVTLDVSTYGFYDNFSTFASGSLVGQQSWTQLGTLSSSSLQITGGQVGLTGGLTNNAQTVYKNITLTNETVFYGLTLTVTNAPNTNGVPYFVALYTSTNGTPVAQFRLAAESPDPAMTNYVLGIRITVSPYDPYAFGATGLNYGTQYRVIVQAASGTNAVLYVNPTSGDIGAQTPYATDAGSGISTVGSVAISQLDSGTIPSVGGFIGKFVVADNFGTVYTDLLAPALPAASFSATPTSGAAPLAVSFTDSSSNSPTSWSWTFGDGGTSTSENPLYTYVTPGAWTAQLIASNAGGSSTNTAVITVYAPFAWWQLQYFGTNSNPNTGPSGDYTGTGMSNTNKFLAGFNPINPAAYLHVISIVKQSPGGNTNVVVTYLGPNGDNTYTPGIASRTNVLDYITGSANGSYTNGGWQDTGQTNVLSGGNGSGVITTMTDTVIAGTLSSRYYRVRVLLP